MQGKIIKGIAGFYYVHVENQGLYECKAKGIFRNQNIKPLVGDNVLIEVLNQENKKGNIVNILERENTLTRPNVANVDQAVIIFSVKEPIPSFNLLDRFLIMMAKQNVSTVICFNKTDLTDKESIEIIKKPYLKGKYKIIIVSAKSKEGVDELEGILTNKTTVVAGPSGVGKSSLINILVADANMEVGDISRKLKRGKHTTRHSEIHYVKQNTYIIDTPGFSSLDINDIEREELKDYFPEFIEYNKKCRFVGCLHLKEPDCAVKKALSENKISGARYESYKLNLEYIDSLQKYW